MEHTKYMANDNEIESVLLDKYYKWFYDCRGH